MCILSLVAGARISFETTGPFGPKRILYRTYTCLLRSFQDSFTSVASCGIAKPGSLYKLQCVFYNLKEGGIEIFGFAVLDIFLIGFSVFVSKDVGFSVLVFNAVCGFFVFGFRKKY